MSQPPQDPLYSPVKLSVNVVTKDGTRVRCTFTESLGYSYERIHGGSLEDHHKIEAENLAREQFKRFVEAYF